jgi:cellulose synthase/poly-beta-1,6-N-acetylglucosamine synthase-like glycosyltransferase
MIIAPDLLLDIRDQLDSAVEDIALSLLITAKGIQISRIDQAVLYDPVPDNPAAASRQRARWFRGQWFAAWQYRRAILSALTKGPGGWSLLASLFLKPRWLFLTISTILALALSRWWIAWFFWGYILFNFLYLMIGLMSLPERKTFIVGLLHLPAYVSMWIRGIVLSLRSRAWLKARKE